MATLAADLFFVKCNKDYCVPKFTACESTTSDICLLKGVEKKINLSAYFPQSVAVLSERSSSRNKTERSGFFQHHLYTFIPTWLNQCPCHFNHGSQARAIVIEAIGETSGIPMSTHHNNLVLVVSKILSWINPDYVCALVNLFSLIPKLKKLRTKIQILYIFLWWDIFLIFERFSDTPLPLGVNIQQNWLGSQLEWNIVLVF